MKLFNHGIGLFFVLLAFITFSEGAHKRLEGKITKVVDGDTIWVAPLNSETDQVLKIRMIGMDTPESHLIVEGKSYSQGKYADMATAKLASLIPVSTEVYVDEFGKDKYGRTLATIYRDEMDVNLELIRQGLAVTYLICDGKECNEDFFEEHDIANYVDTCNEAVKKGMGIFSKNDPLKELPFEFRLRMQKRQPDKYVGNYKTKELVKPADYKKVPVCERIFFMKKQDAINLGFQEK